MEIFQDAISMRTWSRCQRSTGHRIAFVPTMGYLHDGHLSLVRAASEHGDRVVASIYVNPTQFAPHEDFDVYPRDTEGDLEKLRKLGCHAVFMPRELYENGKEHHLAWVTVSDLQSPLCGRSRPTFFRGVATVVAKLFNIVEPDVAVFGRKDYQQWRIISAMVADLNFDIDVIGMPIVREADGLAMSSRNAMLSPDARARAVALPQSLARVEEMVRRNGIRDVDTLIGVVRTQIEAAGGKVDYAEFVCAEHLTSPPPPHGKWLVAVAAHFGAVRLIDNREIDVHLVQGSDRPTPNERSALESGPVST